MPNKQTLVALCSLTSAMCCAVAGHVIKKQEVEIRKLREFQQSIIDVVTIYEAFVPDEVKEEMHDKVVWDATVRELRD